MFEMSHLGSALARSMSLLPEPDVFRSSAAKDSGDGRAGFDAAGISARGGQWWRRQGAGDWQSCSHARKAKVDHRPPSRGVTKGVSWLSSPANASGKQHETTSWASQQALDAIVDSTQSPR